MTSYRQIRYATPPPWAGDYGPRRLVRRSARAFGDDFTDSGDGGDTFDVPDVSTDVEGITVTAGSSPVDISQPAPLLSPTIDLNPNSPTYTDVSPNAPQPDYNPYPLALTQPAPLLSPPIVLSPNTPIINAITDPSWYTTPPTPTYNPLPPTNPIQSFIQSLFPKPPAPKAAGGSGPGAGSSVSATIKPTTPAAQSATAAPGVMPSSELAAGLALAGLVFAAAIFSGHHHRHGSSGGGPPRRRRR